MRHNIDYTCREAEIWWTGYCYGPDKAYIKFKDGSSLTLKNNSGKDNQESAKLFQEFLKGKFPMEDADVEATRKQMELTNEDRPQQIRDF